jgi:hypothetical protein
MSFIAISTKRQRLLWAQLTCVACASALAVLPLMAKASQPLSTEAQLQQLQQQLHEMRQHDEARARTRDNSFNPTVSLVLSGTYARLSQDPDTWRLAGFTSVGEEAGPGARGLNLGESEVTFSASVDPWWYGAMTLAVTPENETGLEEAFVQTTALSDGLTFKAGRFFSGVGYQNEQHAHAWDFIGAPLAYDAFLDGQLGHDGAQLTWLAPLDHYLLLGAELGKGASTGHQAGARAVFARLGGDVGPSNSWRLGVAHLWQQAHRTWDDTDLSGNEVSNGFVGKSRTWAIDGVWKWSPNGNAKQTAFKLQGEYFSHAERGQVGHDVDAQSDDVLGSAAVVDGYRSAQSGWYVQGVYQFMPAWRVGLRHDQLDTGSVDYGSNNATIARVNAQPQRNSLMLDWAPSEFSRWRLQMNQDKARQGVNDTQVYLQYQMNLGAHGAHGF